MKQHRKLEILTPQGLEHGDKQQNMRLQKRTSCERCGTCCKGSAPSLLKEDMALFTSGVLSHADTHTIRYGERVRAQGDGQIYESFMELIKIRGKGHGTVCIFYSDDEGCRIYENRPSQCRQYECWRPVDLYGGLEKNALSRKDLFASVEVLLEVIRRHDEKCSYKRLADALERLTVPGEDAKEDAVKDGDPFEEVIDILQYDMHVRPFLKEKFNVPDDALELVLGRPLVDAINEFGFKVVMEGDEYMLLPIDENT